MEKLKTIVIAKCAQGATIIGTLAVVLYGQR
jgi:hypothetical protein